MCIQNIRCALQKQYSCDAKTEQKCTISTELYI